MEQVLNKIIRYSLYLLVFLLPLWFLPFTVLPVIINKQMLLAVFVFLLFILWMLKIMIEGKLNFAWGKITKSLILLFIILGISTAISSSKIQSFWGMSFEPDTLFSFILYLLVFFLFANLISENQLSSAVISFLASSGILSLFFLIQAFWKPLFPWDFTQGAGFNPVGSVQSLGVFLGGSFVILMALVTGNSAFLQRINQRRISGIILGILLFISIFIINQWVVWLGIALGMVIILWGMLKSISDMRKFILPLFILALSLTFLIIRLPTGNIITLPSEISPTYKATFDIALKTLKENPKNLILGSGPSTFVYQYGLHRGVGPNLTNFWQVRFDQGANAFLTFLTTSGILGTLAILLLISIFLYQGFKKLISDNQRIDQREISGTQLAVFVGGLYYLICGFLYPINLSLLFVVFVILGLWEAISVNQRIVQRKFSGVLLRRTLWKTFLLDSSFCDIINHS